VLSSAVVIAPATASADIALSGLPGSKAAVTVTWRRADNSVDAQATQVFTIAAVRLDDPAAVVALVLDAPEEGDTALITTRPADANGTEIANAPFANTLSLSTVAP
jgi:hypothetical protein